MARSNYNYDLSGDSSGDELTDKELKELEELEARKEKPIKMRLFFRTLEMDEFFYNIPGTTRRIEAVLQEAKDVQTLSSQILFHRKALADAKPKKTSAASASTQGPAALAAGAGGGIRPPVVPPVAGKEATDPAPAHTTPANKK